MATTITLKNIPADIYSFIQTEQAKIKIEKKQCIFSLESTIYKLLKDCKDQKNGSRSPGSPMRSISKT